MRKGEMQKGASLRRPPEMVRRGGVCYSAAACIATGSTET